MTLNKKKEHKMENMNTFGGQVRMAESVSGDEKTYTIDLVVLRDEEIIKNKQLRRDIDAQIQIVKTLPRTRERSLCITKLQEAVMWLGMDLKRLNEQNPYPNSKDPSNTKIDTTADGLKF